MIEEERKHILLEIRKIKSVSRNFEKSLSTGIDLLQNLQLIYNNGDVDTKHQIIGSIFPENLVIDSEKVRTNTKEIEDTKK